MIEIKGILYTVDIDNHTVMKLEENETWDFSQHDINAVTIQNAGNVVAYLNDDWYFPPGSVIQFGSQHDLNKYKGKIKVRFTSTVIEEDPTIPVGAQPLVQAWPLITRLCKCKPDCLHA